MPMPKTIPVYVKMPELKRVEDAMRRQYAELNKQSRVMPISMPLYLDEGKSIKTELSKIVEAALMTLARDMNTISRGTWEQYAARYSDIPKRKGGGGESAIDMSMVTHVVITDLMRDALDYLKVKMPQDLDIHAYMRQGAISPVVIGAIAIIHSASKV